MSSIEKLDLSSPDLVNENFEKLAALFPNCVTEGTDGKAIDFDLLKQELNHAVVEGNKERYRLEWPGKREAIVTANLPLNKTLRPIRKSSSDFENTQNLYLEGDNLEVLKLLQESYLGKIKMIYIDPPYNTGNDFVYKDNFTKELQKELIDSGQKDEYNQRLIANPETSGRYHSDWLSMMYPRLKLARNLLTDDGVIFISIGEQEVHNLRSICNEIFGEINFIGGAGRISKKANNKGDYWAPNFDHVLTYCKIREYCTPFFGGINYSAYQETDQSGSRAGEKYQSVRLYMSSLDPRPNQRYFIECPDGSFVIPPGDVFPTEKKDGAFITPQSNRDKVWRWSYTSYLQKKDEIVVKRVKSSNLVDQDGKPAKWNVFTKTYLNDVIAKSSATPNNFIENHINQKASHELKKIDIPFTFAKPTSLIEFLAECCRLDSDDILLDFFSGSGSSAHAILNLNAKDNGKRKYIQVQIPIDTEENSLARKEGYEKITDLGKERIQRAASSIKKETNADIDYGFRVYHVDSSNMQDVFYTPQEYDQGQLDLLADNVKPDRTSDDLLAQVMLDWGLPLSLKIERATIAGKEVFKVEENSLYACFDTGIDEAFAKVIAADAPLRIVFKDNGFKDDTAKTNVKQLLKQLSPETEMKVI
ncbi:site-specific DNA-methyltransferase [Muricauda sp. HICW]|uniref:site-specific DNA-methyltransferase (adenine-specific) n=1 Tax=Flagellimonas chongwuensis TaxID=2697365 RepID=A0A850NJU8_9FLAO|nr:site-specific DNA-methyltransferase [Allomuricauda chongwuensis]NVN19436.1 site-specific DNA-methyltransferase [Allomuricauda chongwuensis]